MSVRKELRGSEETLKTPVIFTTKADIWPPFQMNIISGMESLVELPSMSTTAGAVNTTTDVKRQAEEEEEKEDNKEEECGREAVSSRKRITYPFDGALH
ncbi:unnamed protein product [Dibothriocephalus latus]|uniref:Uncharacterized protein n=1 Tax=Dibothriocephalus latus TaxID=60516 RepID=A0A3P6R147_DIBLA|nr:unnamed protein product [Dibothriocephalus latus]